MMRWRVFALYASITIVLVLMCVSDFFAGSGSAKKLGARLLFCVLWPVAALSSKGRDLLFKQGRGL